VSAQLAKRGEVRWALVPYAFEAPFRSPDWSGPIGISDLDEIVRAREGRSAIVVEVPAKIRPVLLLQSVAHAAHGTCAALRVKRIEALSESLRDGVRSGEDPSLAPLRTLVAGREHAVIVTAPVAVHLSAVASAPIARLSGEEMRGVDERLARVLELDLDRLVEERAVTLLEALGVGSDQP
jgi:hypothetical protein